MIGSFYVTLLLTLAGACAAWLAGSYKVRIAIISAISLLLLFVASPLILLLLAFFPLIYLALAGLGTAGAPTDARKLASWVFFAPLALPAVVSREEACQALLGPAYVIDPGVVHLAFLGLSYTAIRFFIAFREELEEGVRRPWALAGTALFYGAFSAGPIVGTRPYRRENIALHLDGKDTALAMARIGWGAAKLLVLSRVLTGLAVEGSALGLDTGSALAAWLSMYKAFLALYLDFSGYTDIALGLALLLGIRLPENFRDPLLATSMQDFWQRWHLSLGSFISTYLFKPLVRRIGRPAPAIFVAFVFVGLWHEVTWTYLLWGIGHGAALALNMTFNRRWAGAGLRARPAWRALGWATTMTWVSLLSMVANAASLSAALDKVAALVGA